MRLGSDHIPGCTISGFLRFFTRDLRRYPGERQFFMINVLSPEHHPRNLFGSQI